jgi:cytochrome c-type biogenesis protein CcmH
MAKWLLPLLLAFSSWSAQANEALPASEDPVLEANVMRISSELRCLVCQNQTIADSHAGLAIDLRNQVREMVKRGQSEKEITEYMTARYGDFVLYRPPVKSTTLVLWLAPGAMVLCGLASLAWVLRRRSQMPAENFDPDPADPDQDAKSPQLNTGTK